MRSLLPLAIGPLLLAVPATAPAQDVAFLLGRREHTVLIVVRGDSVRARSGAGLIVPRPTGWWRVGVDSPTVEYPELRARVYPRFRADSIRQDSIRRFDAEHPLPPNGGVDTPPADTAAQEETNMLGEPIGHEACFGHVIWAAPLGSWPVLPDSICAEEEQGGGHWSFTFVGPTLVTMYTGITGDYSYNFARGMVAAPLESLRRTPVTGVDAGWELLEDERDPRWRREVRRCTREYNRDFWDAPDDTLAHDYVGTLITRAPGRWVYTRYYANTSTAGRGSESACDLQIPVPASITGWDRLTVPMRVVKQRVPDAVDAFTSPAQGGAAVAVVLVGDEARVFRVARGTLGAELGVVALGSLPILPDAAGTMMAQWATGTAARRWEKELAPVLPEPIPVRRPSAAGAQHR